MLIRIMSSFVPGGEGGGLRVRREPSRAATMVLFALRGARVVFCLPLFLWRQRGSRAADADAGTVAFFPRVLGGRSWDRWWRGRLVPGPTHGTTQVVDILELGSP